MEQRYLHGNKYTNKHIIAAKGCPVPPTIGNASRITLATDTIQVYRCREGYKFPDNTTHKTIECLPSRTWSIENVIHCIGILFHIKCICMCLCIIYSQIIDAISNFFMITSVKSWNLWSNVVTFHSQLWTLYNVPTNRSWKKCCKLSLKGPIFYLYFHMIWKYYCMPEYIPFCIWALEHCHIILLLSHYNTMLIFVFFIINNFI